MKTRLSTQQMARQRAEMIMKVRCGLMTARQAADRKAARAAATQGRKARPSRRRSVEG